MIDDPQKPAEVWRLDPTRMPKRVDLELSDEVYAVLLALSERSGLSIRDIVETLIAQSLSLPLTHEDP